MDLYQKMRGPKLNKDKVSAIEHYIGERGLRLAPLRRIILEILVKEKEHLTVAQIHLVACKNKYDFAVASVFRNINTLVSIGVVEAHQFKKGYTTYELAGAEPHDHFIDLTTGKARELHHNALDVFKAAIVEQYGYKKEECYLRLYAYPKEQPTGSIEQDSP